MAPPKRILVASDGSATARAAMHVAAALARRTRAELHVAHVLDDRTAAPATRGPVRGLRQLIDRPELRRERALAALESAASAVDAGDARRHVPMGDPEAEIRGLREQLDVDLLVAGAQGTRPLRHFLLGSVAERLLHHPGCPLLLVRDAPPGGEFKRILVGVEQTDSPTPWLQYALELAHALRGEVNVLHVTPPHGYTSDRHTVDLDPAHAPERIPERIERLAAAIDRTIPLGVRVQPGDPSDVIPQASAALQAELVVLGAEWHADGWPGQVVERAAHAGLPALLVVWPAHPTAGTRPE